MGCNLKIVLLVGVIVGLALVVVAAVLGFAVLPGVVDDKIDESVILDKEGTDQYDRFVELPFPLNFTITFFNINNAEKVMLGEEYPNVTEIGPIVYAKHFRKENIEHVDGNTIIFNANKTHNFLEEYSAVKEDQDMTVINAPLVSSIQIVDNLLGDVPLIGPVVMRLISEGYKEAFELKEDTFFHTVKIGDYSFNGYKFCKKETLQSKGAKFMCSLIRVKGSPTLKVKSDHVLFSFFDHKNGVDPKTYEIEDGTNDINKLGDIVRYGGKERTEFWAPDSEMPDNKCNQVRGTDSTIYGAHNDKETVFSVFNTDICRVVEMEYTEEIEYSGIPGYRNSIKRDTMNASLEENECYCIKETKNLDGKKECFPSGFTDMSNCLSAPIVLSFPHFLWADEEYSSTVVGLNPVEEDHKIYIDMEPNTGSPMVGRKRVQFNIVLRPYHSQLSASLLKVKNSMVPIVWIDENVQIPDNLVQTIKDQYLTPVTAIDISKWVLIGVGIVMTIGFGGFYLYKRKS